MTDRQTDTLYKSLVFKKASIEDAKIIFDLANDPVTRQNSFSTAEIKWEDHIKCFSRKIEDVNCDFYILKDGDSVIGSIRVDYDNDKLTGLISYNVSANHRRRGYGTKMIQMITDKARKGYTLVGEVKKTNVGSIKCFENNNYIKSENEDEYIYKKEV